MSLKKYFFSFSPDAGWIGDLDFSVKPGANVTELFMSVIYDFSL